MSPTSHPLNNAQMGAAQWAALADNFAWSGVVGDLGSGAMAPSRTGSGVFVAAGSAILRGVLHSRDSADAADPVAGIVANTSASQRLDRLVLRQNGVGAPTLVHLQGNATRYPDFASSLTGAFDVPIARMTMPSGASVPSVVEDDRMWVGAPVVPCTATAQIPTARRRIGMIATGPWGAARWSGTAWDAIALQSDLETLKPFISRNVQSERTLPFNEWAPFHPLTAQVEDGSGWSYSTGLFRVPRAGKYGVTASAQISATTGRIGIRLVSGSAVLDTVDIPAHSSGEASVPFAHIVKCSAGAPLQMQVRRTQQATAQLVAGGVQIAWLNP